MNKKKGEEQKNEEIRTLQPKEKDKEVKKTYKFKTE